MLALISKCTRIYMLALIHTHMHASTRVNTFEYQPCMHVCMFSHKYIYTHIYTYNAWQDCGQRDAICQVYNWWQDHSQRDAKGPRQIDHDGAWVHQEQSRCSHDPPAHFREVPIRRYSGCPQSCPSNAGSPNTHAMLLGRKGPTAAPHWKDKSI